jgi:signal transduction histidine kinase
LISQRVEDYQQAQQVAETSKASEQIRSEIIQNVRLQLKSPLSEIDQQVNQYLRNSDNLNSTQNDAVSIIVENIERYQQIMDALETLENATPSQNIASVDVVDLTRQAVDRFQVEAEQNSVKIQSDLPAQPILVRVDYSQISQVFDALLSNAVRYSNEGTVTVRVAVDKNKRPHVSIQDSGPGIPKEYQEQIFHPFNRGASSNDGHDGLGIGLSLAREIIKAHHGKIWVESPSKNSSIFHFTLRASK